MLLNPRTFPVTHIFSAAEHSSSNHEVYNRDYLQGNNTKDSESDRRETDSENDSFISFICDSPLCFLVTPISQFLIILGRCTLYTPVCLQDEPTCMRIEPV